MTTVGGMYVMLRLIGFISHCVPFDESLGAVDPVHRCYQLAMGRADIIIATDMARCLALYCSCSHFQ